MLTRKPRLYPTLMDEVEIKLDKPLSQRTDMDDKTIP